MSPTDELSQGLIREIGKQASVVVAFSGGVDSAVVAAAAFRAFPDRSIAITGVGQAVPDSDLQSARAVAAAIHRPRPRRVRPGPRRRPRCP